MAEYDNTNRGVLFKNDRKEKDSHPDYKGSVNVGGTEFWLSAWIKEGQKGKFMSLSVQAKDDTSGANNGRGTSPQQPASKPAGGAMAGFEDDVPW